MHVALYSVSDSVLPQQVYTPGKSKSYRKMWIYMKRNYRAQSDQDTSNSSSIQEIQEIQEIPEVPGANYELPAKRVLFKLTLCEIITSGICQFLLQANQIQ